ncbi:MAG: sulfite exporter TauE/SafE family protein [Sedimentisphaerales bacterium]|nr:sulfite exporter TauE/SafE family protein [Sedimentisphaerales bacterium]
MPSDSIALLPTAAFLGFFHTLVGPDHYLPFIMMATARKWSRTKTAVITLLCGVGHVSSSVVLGLVGVGLGMAVTRLEGIESYRGDLAAWALLAFGLVYFVWGVRRAYTNRPHTHRHIHPDGHSHEHEHVHHQEHTHLHADRGRTGITPWALFVVFVLGPCEVLIPLLMYPAAQKSMLGLALVTLVFATTTIATMLALVLAASYGIRLLPLQKIERYSHAIAGATICLCALAIHWGL